MLQQLAHYKIQALIGEGSFAWVYRAFDTKLERPVALKILKPIWMSDRQAVQRLMQEAKTMAKMHHPNIIEVYDVGETEGQLYMAQFLAEGQNLAERITKEPFTWDAMLDVVQDISAALDYAHDLGIIHRDIKPTNILLDANQKAYLGDFGLVRIVEESASLSASTTMVGTARYVAPEIWDGKAATPATDVYALSCVIYEMLTGDVLFEGSSVMSVIKKHVDGPTFPDTWPISIPQGFSIVLQKGLTKNPAIRFSQVSEFVTALAEIGSSHLKEAPAKSGVRTPPTYVQQTAHQNNFGKFSASRWFWLGAAAILLGLGICLSIIFFGLGGSYVSGFNYPFFNATVSSTPTNTLLVRTVVPIVTATQDETTSTIPTMSPTPSPTATIIPMPALKSLVRLNVRTGPGTMFDVIGILDEGTTAEVVGRDEARQWWQIRYEDGPNGLGWVSAEYSETSFTSHIGVAEIPPTPTPTKVPKAPVILFFTADPDSFVESDLPGSAVLRWSVEGEVDNIEISGPALQEPWTVPSSGEILVQVNEPRIFVLSAHNKDTVSSTFSR